jgi:phosphoribosylformimino-5-aminoimidazole carboxamide ribonucleotide (ProFAR) isomerase
VRLSLSRPIAWLVLAVTVVLGTAAVRDPAFVQEVYEAYAALEEILALPGLYTNAMVA